MQSTIAHKNCRTAKSKVKSGCKTCKRRKVKCDEGHPACSRCISTGRVCDGYGIWGNGGNFYGQRQRPAASTTSTTSTFRDSSDTIVSRPAIISFFVASMEEKEYFDWFKCRTAWKLPGTFISDFWITLLLQSSLSEPAILHAILALSSVHKGGILNSDRQEQTNGVPDKQEQFTLQHYVKAISYLQPHFSAKDKASIRVALIACIVFVSLDFLRGHFTTAQIHLQNGLKLLGETQSLSNKNDGDGLLLLRPCHEAIDGWIVEAFSRLYSQVELFKHLYQHPCLLLQVAEPGPPTLIFFTFKEAWHELERLLNKIFHLTKQAREHEVGNPSVRHSALLEHQQRIQMELARWLNTYEESRTTLIGQNSLPEKKAYQLVRIHHIMVTIMADTCLYPADEGIYDKHTNQFIHLMKHLTDLWTSISSIRPHYAPPGHIINMSGTIVDIAWIPPLYYTAVKCRVHQIRLQAVRLLESSFHREGIWDSKIVARISRKVVEMEERDYYGGGVVDPGDDDFPLSNFLSELDLSLPLLPREYRIRDVEVVLQGEPMDKVLLFCRQSRDGMDFKVRIGEYRVSSQCWMDVDRS